MWSGVHLFSKDCLFRGQTVVSQRGTFYITLVLRRTLWKSTALFDLALKTIRRSHTVPYASFLFGDISRHLNTKSYRPPPQHAVYHVRWWRGWRWYNKTQASSLSVGDEVVLGRAWMQTNVALLWSVNTFNTKWSFQWTVMMHQSPILDPWLSVRRM